MEELPKRKPLRLEGYDYSTAGTYFVTFCTHERRSFLGAVPCVGAIHESPAVRLSDYGEIVERYILELPQRFPFITFATYVIMPNHVHLLLTFAETADRAIRESPLRQRTRLSQVVGYLKMNAGRDIRSRNAMISVWHRGYHDHIIRDESDYLRALTYMDENPTKWSEDCYYTTKE